MGGRDCKAEVVGVGESAAERAEDAVPHGEAEALGGAALEGAGPADAHCVLDADRVSLAVAQAVGVRVAPLAWIEAVAESCAGMEGDMGGE